MIRRPPSSALFPFPTLFRSQGAGAAADGHLRRPPHHAAGPHVRAHLRRHRRRCAAPVRSEEHTSELQSRQYIVCRLLLEKKKDTKHYSKYSPLKCFRSSSSS